MNTDNMPQSPYYKNGLFLLMFLTGSCSQQNSLPEAKIINSSKVPAQEQLLDPFWVAFQTALDKKDTDEIMQLTSFPLKVNLANIEGFEDIKNQEGFKKHFKTLFPDSAIRTLLQASPSAIQANGDHRNQTGEIWTVDHTKNHKISEKEWSIIYTFSRTSNGKIKMTAVDFAG